MHSGADRAPSVTNVTGVEVTLSAFPAALVSIACTATHAPTGLQLHRTATVHINYPPTGPPEPVILTAPQGPLVAGSPTVVLSTPASAWSPFWANGAPLEYQFAIQLPDASLVSIPGHATFSPASQISFRVPWVPTTSNIPQNYTFVLFVKDAFGAQAGPLRALRPVTVQPPTCPTLCRAARSVLELASCLTCGGPVPADALSQAVIAHIDNRTLTAHAAHWLLRDTAVLARRLYASAAPAHFAARLQLGDVLVAATRPHHHAPSLPPLLFAALDAVLHAGGPPTSAPAQSAGQSLIADAAAAVWRSGPGTRFGNGGCGAAPALEVDRPFPLRVSRVPTVGPPPSVTVGAVSVAFPATLGHALAAQAPAGVDLTAFVLPAAPGLVVGRATVAFAERSNGTEVAVAQLPAPAAITWPVDGAVLERPVREFYRCVYQDAGAWSPVGTWLAEPGPAPISALTCHTTHLSTFSIQAMPRVHTVSGCGRPVGNTSLDCPGPPLALTIAGRNFGPSGAVVYLRAGGSEVECGDVEHVGGREGSTLVCRVTDLPRGAAPPGGLYAAVRVVTQYGTAHTLDPAVMFAGAPVIAAVVPLSSGCVAAGAHALANCPATGADFAVLGEGLVGWGRTRVAVGPSECPEVAEHNASYVECLGVRGTGGPHTVAVTIRLPGRSGGGGRFTVTFADECAALHGFWAGPGCAACAPNYYGPDCAHQCPGPADGVCSGHGACDGGTTGSGQCLCSADPVHGQWAGEACERCRDGYVGPDCRTACPAADVLGNGVNRTCAGHGVCGAAPPGGARCDCRPPWSGHACELQCPGTPACAGHGRCEAGPSGGPGLCACAGHWGGAACDRCAPGWVGPACAAACPGLDAPAGACAGHGRCLWDGTAPVCACDPGYVGAACALPCPADPSGQFCSGRGQCEASEGAAVCVCVRDSTAGYWSGRHCETCAGGYSGSGCAIACPRAASGAICSGSGNCTGAGACACIPGSCGAACEFEGSDCTATCPAGRFGPDCSGVCGCTAHGTCDDGRHGSGACTCAPGWAGPTCDTACEGALAGTICNGHGRCSPETGACVCAPGWRTLPGAGACATSCPGPQGAPCSGRGTCTAAAVCECDPGYGGPDCGLPCPRDAWGRACSGHGACDAATGACACDASNATGHWAGAECDACAPGYFGADCRRVCAAGQTAGQQCVCAPGWAGEGCGQQCLGGAASPCSGHGACRRETGLCSCWAGFGGPACAAQCPRAGGAVCGGHGRCDAATGECLCHDAPMGHWAGPACAECAGAYSGPACASLCPVDAAGVPCAAHGACASGGCRCRSDAVAGHWAGDACDRCAPGYYGADCRAECPGGSCRPCGGHGVCNEGRLGNGSCTCDRGPLVGHWDPAAGCGECQRGWYAPGCVRACPGGPARPCGGHGLCSDGVHGSGACACNAAPETGFWGAPDCRECAPGYYGPDCTQECPGSARSPCGGAGVCSDGVAGTGACACVDGFVGAVCGGACPRDAWGVPCSGHGTCGWSAAAAEAVCACDADPLAGHWAGPHCAACHPGYFGPDCARPCPGPAAEPCSGRGTCRDGVSGTGLCACDAGYAAADCGRACPGLAQGRICNGHGRCDQVTGACVCDPGDAVQGHWAGTGCQACAEGWSGVACAAACPRAAVTGAVCGGRGTCAVGACVCGAGACGPACEWSGAECRQCAPGRWGSDCQQDCPGGAASPCGGHGRCLDGAAGSGRCVCDPGYGGPECERACPAGAGGAACSARGRCDGAAAACLCDAGYAGAACDRACPRTAAPSAAVCGGPGRGVCADGAAGSGNCTCALGFAGAACQHACAGVGPAGVCSGHGACSADTGACVCAAQWAGVACAVCRDGWYGPGCTLRCFRGRSVGGRCECELGWATADCSVECAGGAALPCTGHGRCNATRAGDGACACDPGWRGVACTVPCAGLTATQEACGGHGACNSSGSCACARSSMDGYWDGEACGRCAEGYGGPDCRAVCPGAPGIVCGGHGACNAVTAACECYQDPGLGYWAAASDCTQCLPGYWGSECTAVCPGALCDVCSGHGQCDDGVQGSGACACDARWAGVACSQCAPGQYGPGCNASCPTGGSSPGPCAGHGACQDGLYGSGLCVCEQSATAGMWAGPDCSECTAGYWGSDCRGTCPRGTSGEVCGGHGTCRDGRAGDGACACAGVYWGAACERTCPASGPRLCNGVAPCDPVLGVCNCSAAPRGHWQGPACAACRAGWVGSDCSLPCPRSPGGLICAGHGACHAGAGFAPQCACDRGYYGPACAGECAGGALLQCSGHGTCDPIDGACDCLASETAGFWAGPQCAECRSGWSGAGCRARCPAGAGGVPCSGHPCRNGACICGDPDVCGGACNVTGAACSVLSCPAGRWGPGCAGHCPRGGAGAVCGGHGECLAKVYGDGRCHCTPPYAGADCRRTCRGGPQGACSGAGACDPVDGACLCYAGFAGADCGIRCPVGAGRVCGGHGACNDTAAGDGSCTCAAGYVGRACTTLCPGFDPEAPGASVCGGHGRCLSEPARCSCEATAEGGYWTGTTCEECAAGWFGDGCDRVCVHGATRGRVCVCREGYGTANCSAACPGPEGRPCSGHGACLDGHARSASCLCAADWYAADCGTYCDPRVTCPSRGIYPAPHFQCNARTGACECQANASGHWAGPECNECQVGYWGPNCAALCDCNGRGPCGSLDGVCRCFQDAARGYWAGAHCEACSDGYLAPACQARNVAISRPRELPVVAQAEGGGARGGMVLDEAYHLLYTGGQPLLVIDTETDAVVASFWLAGAVRAGYAHQRVVTLLVEAASGALSVARIARGRSPVYMSASPAHHRKRRPMPVQGGAGATAAADPVAQMFEFRGLVHYFFYQKLQTEAYVVLSSADGRSKPHPIATAALQLTDIRGCVAQTHANNETALYLIGAWQGRWQMTTLPLPPPRPPIPLQQVLQRGLPLCAPTTPCLALGGLAFGGGAFFMALERAADLVLARGAVADWRVARSAPVPGVGGGAAVDALAFDPVLGALFLAFHRPGQPSEIYKANATTLVVYGAKAMRARGGHPEVVARLALDLAPRRMYALTAVGPRPLVVTFALYAVLRVEPPLADAAGGTALTVTSEGFPESPGPAGCQFASGATTPATWVAWNRLTCLAPRVNATAEGCAGEAVELLLGPDLATANRVPVRRVPTPSVLAVAPRRGYYARAQWVRVRGYGFLGSASLRCRFFAAAHPETVAGPGNVRFVSSTEVLCRQPDLTQLGPFPAPSYLEVSIDGQKYSRSLKEYHIVGAASAIEPDQTTITVEAAAASGVPALHVYTVDTWGHRVLGYDLGEYRLTAEIKSVGRVVNTSGAVTAFRAGVANFPVLALHRPRTGDYALRLRCDLGPAAGVVVAHATIRVVEGKPVRLHILRQPSPVTSNAGPLGDQPVVVLKDAAANVVTAPPLPKGTGLLALAHVVPAPDNATAQTAVFTEGAFEFRGIRLVARYGVAYALIFSLAPAPGLEVANATSRVIRAQPCARAQYYVYGQTACSECPMGAACNGTDVLLTRENYWRQGDSLRFFECSDVGGEEGPRCRGGFVAGTCSLGFKGPLCAECGPGRMGEGCARCPARALSALLLLAICAAYLLLIGFTIWRAFRVAPGDKKQTFSLIFKIGVTHLQTLGTLQDIFPGAMGGALATAGDASSIRIPSSVVRCAVPSMDTFAVFYAYMLLPALAPVFVSAVVAYDRSLACMPSAAKVQLHPEQQARARARTCTRGRSLLHILLLTGSVILYFLYPTLLLQNARLQDCAEYDFGTGRGPQSFLATDFSVDCGGAAYQSVQYSSVVFILAYGVGIPLAFALLGAFLDRADERQSFAFLMAGFKGEYRYWEILNMARKGLLIAAVTFLADPLRVYCTGWILLAFLALQWACRPFETARANTLETASLAILVVTVNAVLLWSQLPSDPGHAPHARPWEVAAAALVLALHFALLACLFLTAATDVRAVLWAWLASRRRRAMEERVLDSSDDELDPDRINLAVHGKSFMRVRVTFRSVRSFTSRMLTPRSQRPRSPPAPAAADPKPGTPVHHRTSPTRRRPPAASPRPGPRADPDAPAGATPRSTAPGPSSSSPGAQTAGPPSPIHPPGPPDAAAPASVADAPFVACIAPPAALPPDPVLTSQGPGLEATPGDPPEASPTPSEAEGVARAAPGRPARSPAGGSSAPSSDSSSPRHSDARAPSLSRSLGRQSSGPATDRGVPAGTSPRQRYQPFDIVQADLDGDFWVPNAVLSPDPSSTLTLDLNAPRRPAPRHRSPGRMRSLPFDLGGTSAEVRPRAPRTPGSPTSAPGWTAATAPGPANNALSPRPCTAVQTPASFPERPVPAPAPPPAPNWMVSSEGVDQAELSPMSTLQLMGLPSQWAPLALRTGTQSSASGSAPGRLSSAHPTTGSGSGSESRTSDRPETPPVPRSQTVAFGVQPRAGVPGVPVIPAERQSPPTEAWAAVRVPQASGAPSLLEPAETPSARVTRAARAWGAWPTAEPSQNRSQTLPSIHLRPGRAPSSLPDSGTHPEVPRSQSHVPARAPSLPPSVALHHPRGRSPPTKMPSPPPAPHPHPHPHSAPM